MPTYVKIETGIVSKAIFDQHVEAHKDYVRELIIQGHKARSGYWKELGGGMLIFEATSLAEAKKVISKDPLVIHKCVHYEIHEWCIVIE